MGSDLFEGLVEATLAGSMAVVLVLVLRRPLRAALGAGAAYVLWLCVPVALLAVLLPRGVELPLALPAAWQMAPMVVVSAAAQPQRGSGWIELLVALWLGGVLASAALLAWQQWRFRRALGPLRLRDDGLYQSATATAGLPAVAGVLRPRILLPADFEHRYSERERALVVQHERLHVRRGDLVANALAALLRCLFWFHPLLPSLLRRFRLDQELACDEAVIARNPRARRAYGEAMLKTQFDELPLPLGCHWQARHPIKERIDMLKRPTPTPLHWMAAVLFALGLSAAAGYTAWAAQPAPEATDRAPTPVADGRGGASAANREPVVALKMPPPRYPEEAAHNYVGGKVMLLVTVDVDGSVADVRVEESTPAGVFDAVTVEAARQWKFEPAIQGGKPVRGRVRIPVTFEATPEPQGDGSA